MERYLRVGVITLVGLLLVLLVWFAVFANQDNKRSPNPAKTQSAIELDDQLSDPEIDIIDNAEVDQESLNKLLPQLEQLAAPISDDSQNDEQSQNIARLQQEADQLIEEMDQLLLDSDFQEPDMTQVDHSEIYQHPEFQEGLKQEEALEERLNSLP